MWSRAEWVNPNKDGGGGGGVRLDKEVKMDGARWEGKIDALKLMML